MGLPIQTKLALHLLALVVALPKKGFSVFNFFNGGKYKFLKNTDFTYGLSSKTENEHWCHSDGISLACTHFSGH